MIDDKFDLQLGLGAASQMCLAPFMCTTVTGECCEIFFNEGRIRCPITCNPDLKRQSDVTANVSAQNGYSLSNIFSTTLVTTLMYNVLNSITATTSVPTATTTTTTMTTTLSPIITTSMFLVRKVKIELKNIEKLRNIEKLLNIEKC